MAEELIEEVNGVKKENKIMFEKELEKTKSSKYKTVIIENNNGLLKVKTIAKLED